MWPLLLGEEVCSNLLLNLTGSLLAPSDPADYVWVKNTSYLQFSGCKNLTVHGWGSGVIDGRGTEWSELFKKTGANRPYLCVLDSCEEVTIRNVTLQNSPMFHLVPHSSKNVLVDRVTIHAPNDSPNTDGIDPSGSENVRITHCNIALGMTMWP